jgi:hypothetical protein
MKNETYIADIPQSGKIRLVRYGDFPQRLTNHTCCALDIHMPAEKPWKLGRFVNGFTLAEGQEWHRDDFTTDMVPPGWRPLLLGEKADHHEDKWYDPDDGDWNNYPDTAPANHTSYHRRTRRPLPDPYAELKAAHAEGKVIEVSHRNEDGTWREWGTYACLWLRDETVRYRIKPDTAPDADGWIPHDGGGCPVEGETLCERQYSDSPGKKCNAIRAKNINWRFITHYRIEKPCEKKFGEESK